MSTDGGDYIVANAGGDGQFDHENDPNLNLFTNYWNEVGPSSTRDAGDNVTIEVQTNRDPVAAWDTSGLAQTSCDAGCREFVSRNPQSLTAFRMTGTLPETQPIPWDTRQSTAVPVGYWQQNQPSWRGGGSWDRGHGVPVQSGGETVVSIGSNSGGYNGGYWGGNQWGNQNQGGDNITVVSSGPANVNQERIGYGDFEHKTTDVSTGHQTHVPVRYEPVQSRQPVRHEPVVVHQPDHTYNDETARIGVIFKGGSEVLRSIGSMRNGGGDFYDYGGRQGGRYQNIHQQDWRYNNGQWGGNQRGGDNIVVYDQSGRPVTVQKERIGYGDFEHTTTDVRTGGSGPFTPGINGNAGIPHHGRGRGPTYNDETARIGVLFKGGSEVLRSIGIMKGR